MKYTGYSCAFCGKTFTEEDDVAVCPVCGTPHHRACYQETKNCANASLHEQGFVWQYTMQSNDPGTGAYTGPDAFCCPRCGFLNDPHEPVCVKCGERLYGVRQQMPTQQEQFGYSYDQSAYKGDDYNQTGYNQNGYNQNGYNQSGYNQSGYNQNAYGYNYQNRYEDETRAQYGNAYIEDVPAGEVAQYVQRNSVKYVGRFLKLKEKNSMASWNWSSAIFSVFWCFWRRLPAVGAIFFVAIYSLTILSSVGVTAIYENYRADAYAEYNEIYDELYELYYDYYYSTSTTDSLQLYNEMTSLMKQLYTCEYSLVSYGVQILIYVIGAVVMGILGNYLYMKRALKQIHKLRGMAVDDNSYRLLLRNSGGTSFAGILLPICFYMILSMIFV